MRMGTLASALSDEGWINLITDTNFPGVVLLGLASIPALWLVVKGLLRVQKDFVDYYVKENDKLRERVETLEEEKQEQALLIIELKTTQGQMQNQLNAQAETIRHLNEVIERRSKPRDN